MWVSDKWDFVSLNQGTLFCVLSPDVIDQTFSSYDILGSRDAIIGVFVNLAVVIALVSYI